MAKQMKKVKKPQKIQTTIKEKKPKQGHKLVWFTIIVIAIPCIIVGYVLITSLGGQNKPVAGNRFGKGDLDPEITSEMVKQIDGEMMNIEGVEAVETNLKSATLRISLDISDDASSDTAASICDKAYARGGSSRAGSADFANTDGGEVWDGEIAPYT